MRDGRLTNAELAERVNLSPSACLRRVRALEEGGLIAGYVMLLDTSRANMPGVAFVSAFADLLSVDLELSSVFGFSDSAAFLYDSLR